ncbi:nucleotidyltransferase domain-containing protein [Kribbella antibiotica]|uniref:Nucleotidyltransferase domain-containing protein n=1 Tax=Kribbella antibiotica TaxID=190195 RepID=A0A4R4YQY4_9ACTN|nr:nucleotidyltransferase domain-containing protein [Kribbella antibiotica]TDD47591.1 nucleotidyltransferase domain-containing protein [Kribbella antibiotica]
MKFPETLSAERRGLIERAAAALECSYGAGFLGMVLSGSAGRGVETERSDLDVIVVVTPELVGTPLTRNTELELLPVTLKHLETLAVFGDDQWGYRWSYAWAPTLLDKTGGRIAQAIERQTSLSAEEAHALLEMRLDAWLNMSYRSLKSARDGNLLEARMDAAEAMGPFLDVVFALDGQVRPYNKYLQWTLEHHPLKSWPSGELLNTIEQYLAGNAEAIRESLKHVQRSELPLVHEAFDEWSAEQYDALRHG